jgi:hypothetical protein
VVTPKARSAAPPRVPAVERNLSPRNLSEDFLDMRSANHFQSAPAMPMACAVVLPETGKEMEYVEILNEPTLIPLWGRGMGNECGRIFQGLQDIEGKNTCFFIELKNIPKDRKIA